VQYGDCPIARAIIEEHRDPKVLAENAEPLAEHGGDRKSEDQVAHSHLKPANKQSSTSAERLTRRIARDRPEILEEMKAGKYSSVRAAARKAGFVKTLTPLDIRIQIVCDLFTRSAKQSAGIFPRYTTADRAHAVVENRPALRYPRDRPLRDVARRGEFINGRASRQGDLAVHPAATTTAIVCS
jgi:hypothetical protein